LVSAKPLIPREQYSSAPHFWATPIFMPTPQNDQIRLGNTYGEARALGGQPHHCVSTNASRGLSATAEFLVCFTAYSQAGV